MLEECFQCSHVAFLDSSAGHAPIVVVKVNTDYANARRTTLSSIGWEIKLCNSSYNAAVEQFFSEIKGLSGVEECLFSFMSSSVKAVRGSGRPDAQNGRLFACCVSETDGGT